MAERIEDLRFFVADDLMGVNVLPRQKGRARRRTQRRRHKRIAKDLAFFGNPINVRRPGVWMPRRAQAIPTQIVNQNQVLLFNAR